MKKVIALSGLLAMTLSLTTQLVKVPKTLKKNFSVIPTGLAVTSGDTVSVQSFFISKWEVTNSEYRTFLADLKASNKLNEYKMALPDTSQWIMKGATMNAFKDYYFSHPAYDNYPVVNITYENAVKYCEWFTEKCNANPRNAQKLKFRLPLREEFLRACRGDKHNNLYSWDGSNLRNSKGLILCNHTRVDSTAGVAGNLYDNADITAPSKSYWPNDFNIYNLNGNVAEMLHEKGNAIGGSWGNRAEDVTNESISKYEGPSPMVGFRMVATVVKN